MKSYRAVAGRPLESILKVARKAWNEIPDILAGGAVFLTGIGLVGYALHLYYDVKHGDNRRYKLNYVVLRSDDPRAEKVHKD